MKNRNTLNFVVDAAALVAMMGLAGTGLVVRWVLPPGSGGHGDGPGLALWGLGRHGWGDIHFWLAIATVVLLVLHVVLHWRWVCSTTRQLVRADNNPPRAPSGRVHNLYGTTFVIALVVMLGGFYFVAWNSVAITGDDGGDRIHQGDAQTAVVQRIPDDRGDFAAGRRRSGHDEHVGGAAGSSIRGSMTLAEVADANHMGVDRLKDLLGLPADTVPDERLGRLGRRYGFAVSAVRERLATR